MTDIKPGWQDKAQALRELIRTCKHDGEKLRNQSGVLFCAECGLHLLRDDLYNLLSEWVANPAKTSAQPPGTVAQELLDLLEKFEAAVRAEK